MIRLLRGALRRTSSIAAFMKVRLCGPAGAGGFQRNGMSKSAVILTHGLPPATAEKATPIAARTKGRR